MYLEAYEEQIYDRLLDKLGHTFEIKLAAGELQTPEELEKFANRVSVKPHILINLATTAEQIDSDTTSRVSRDELQLELLVCSSDVRDVVRQRKKTIRYVFGTRWALQGYNLTSDYTANTPIEFDTYEELLNEEGLCVYSVEYMIESLVDIDDFAI